jgi:hypothetical protein
MMEKRRSRNNFDDPIFEKRGSGWVLMWAADLVALRKPTATGNEIGKGPTIGGYSIDLRYAGRFVEPHIPKHIKVDWVWHYSQQGRKSNAEIEQKFGEVINRIRGA